MAMRPNSWTAKLKARPSCFASIFMALFVVLSGQTVEVSARARIPGKCWGPLQTRKDPEALI